MKNKKTAFAAITVFALLGITGCSRQSSTEVKGDTSSLLGNPNAPGMKEAAAKARAETAQAQAASRQAAQQSAPKGTGAP